MEIMELFGMSYFELVQTTAINLDTVLAMLQFWITATFAVIVAIYFAGSQLTRPMAILLLCLYVAVSAIDLLSYVQAGNAMLYWNDLTDSVGVSKQLVTQAQFESAQFWRRMSVWAGAAFVTIGTVATVLYGVSVLRSAVADDAGDVQDNPDVGEDA